MAKYFFLVIARRHKPTKQSTPTVSANRLPRIFKKMLAMTIFSSLLLSGCTWIGNTADNIGKHLPTIGEPCRHWQCVTSSGQQRSEEIRQAEEAQKSR